LRGGLDCMVQDGRVGFGYRKGKTPQCGRTKGGDLAGAYRHTSKHRSCLCRRLPVTPHPLHRGVGTFPSLQGVCVADSDSARHGRCLGALGDASLWERELGVPARSQMVYPNGSETWCSPVSLWIVMAYWADRTGRGDINQPIPAVVQGTYDHTYGGNGRSDLRCWVVYCPSKVPLAFRGVLA
jgi:hypothetical protein